MDGREILQGAGGREPGEEFSTVRTVVGEALLSSRVGVAIADTAVTRAEGQADTTSALEAG